MSIIEIKQLTKNYGQHRGIDAIDLTIEEGEIFGFIGPNGAGKSTTIRTLLGLLHPTSGSATIFDKDCIKFRNENAKEIGYLPSEVFYYDHMKVKDLLNYSASFYKKDCSERMQELCEILELDTSRKIEDLSFGNRKKVGIVQGLMHSPKLIILDEPTSGLDPLMQNKFFDLIREEHKKGATVFFSSHILGEVQRLCDRVAIIKEGKILTVEKMETLRQSTYKRIELESKQPIEIILQNIEGAVDVTCQDHHYRFIYKGDINMLLQVFCKLKIDNLDIHEPDLEEIFMHYYQGESYEHTEI